MGFVLAYELASMGSKAAAVMAMRIIVRCTAGRGKSRPLMAVACNCRQDHSSATTATRTRRC